MDKGLPGRVLSKDGEELNWRSSQEPDWRDEEEYNPVEKAELARARREGVNWETIHEGIGDEIRKPAETKLMQEHPMEARFAAYFRRCESLHMLEALQSKYPEEYHRQMQESTTKREGYLGDWYMHGLAGHVLPGVFLAAGNSSLEEIKGYVRDDRLGIPLEFLDRPEIQKWMRWLRIHNNASPDVNDYLCQTFHLQPSPPPDTNPEVLVVEKNGL